MSIYQFTRQKLLSHAVHETDSGRTILNDKRLFLMFVKLERARRSVDFCQIQSSVRDIEEYTKSIGKGYLKVYAYLYVAFSEFAVNVHHLPVILGDGRVRYCKDYRRPVSKAEIAIDAWASLMFDGCSDHCFRAIHRTTNRV
jgi:hypothetical protein